MRRNIVREMLGIVIISVAIADRFILCSSQGQEQDALPDQAGHFPQNPSEPGEEQGGAEPPHSPDDAFTTTTTADPRTLFPFEKTTEEIIRYSNDTMDALQTYLQKYEIQLNLNTLDTLLPVLQEIRRNMTSLLQSSSQTDHSTFKERKLTLDTELAQIEDQIKETRELREHYELLHEITKDQLGSVYKSLGTILDSQVFILGIKHSKKEGPKSDSEIQRFITYYINTSPHETNAMRLVFKYLRELNTPSNRLTGYSHFLSISNYTLNDDEQEAIAVEIARDVLTFPELASLRTTLPPILSLIFKDVPKAMQLRSEGKILTVGVAGQVILGAGTGDGAKRWKFFPIEGTTYFAIVDVKTNQALGQGTAYYAADTFQLLHFDEAIQFKERYHWNIYTIGPSSDGLYLNFINRATNDIMGAITRLNADDEGYSARVYSFYQWTLK